MMFQKDKETGKLTSQVMIDFQLTRYGSPSLDLHYYIFSSVQPAVRKDKMQDMLKIYLEIFNSTCESLGYPMGVSFSVIILFVNNFNFLQELVILVYIF